MLTTCSSSLIPETRGTGCGVPDGKNVSNIPQPKECLRTQALFKKMSVTQIFLLICPAEISSLTSPLLPVWVVGILMEKQGEGGQRFLCPPLSLHLSLLRSISPHPEQYPGL